MDLVINTLSSQSRSQVPPGYILLPSPIIQVPILSNIKSSMPDSMTDEWFPTFLNLCHVAVVITSVCVSNNFHYTYHAILHILCLTDFMANLDH